MARRTGKGRQRISMTRMENQSNLQVTFSKRRTGLFKKASEIATLCGVEVGIIVFSPGHKVFSFGHPSVEAIANRFLTRTPPPSDPTNQLMEAHRNACARDLNVQLANLQAMLEVERQRAVVVDHARALRSSHGKCRWNAPLQELNLDELMELEGAMERLKAKVERQIERFMEEQQQNPSTFSQRLSSFGGGGSSSLGGGVTDVFSFPPGPISFGQGGIRVPQFVKGSHDSPIFLGGGTGGALSFPMGANSYGASGVALSTGLSSFGGGGDALPFSTGNGHFRGGGSGTVLPFSRASSSFGGIGALPVSPWFAPSIGGVSSMISALPFTGKSSYPGRGGNNDDGNVFPAPPGPSSFGGGGALSVPLRPDSFGSGSGGGSGGGAFHFSPETSSYGRGGDGAGGEFF